VTGNAPATADHLEALTRRYFALYRPEVKA
jgi:hypothetical protein